MKMRTRKTSTTRVDFSSKNGIVVDAQRYLEALKVLIEFEAAKNAHANVSLALKKRRVESLEEIANETFDAIVLCCGGEILRDGFLDDSTKRELFEKVGGTLELQAAERSCWNARTVSFEKTKKKVENAGHTRIALSFSVPKNQSDVWTDERERRESETWRCR